MHSGTRATANSSRARATLADADVSFHDPAVGDNFSYQVYTLSYNHYISLAANQVLALRAMAQFESGDVPFYALSKFGRGSDLRGYTVGQFQDDQMFAVQGEYRLEIHQTHRHRRVRGRRRGHAFVECDCLRRPAPQWWRGFSLRRWPRKTT